MGADLVLPPTAVSTPNLKNSQASSRNDSEHTVAQDANHAVTFFYRKEDPKIYLMLVIVATIASNTNQTLTVSAFPAIGNYFNKLNLVFWFSLGYLTISATSQPFFYPLTSVLGIKRFFFICWGLMILCTIISLIGSSIFLLIIGYSLSAFGSIGLSICLNLLILKSSDHKDHKRFYGFSGFVHNVGNLFGPLFGATLVNKHTFRSVFLIQLVVSVIGLSISLYSLWGSDDTQTKTAKWSRFDYLGALLLVLSIPPLIFCLNGVYSRLVFNKQATIILGCVAAVCISAFIYNELKTKRNPLIPMEIYTRRNEMLALISLFLIGPRFVSSSYYIPLFSTVVKNFKPFNVGLVSTSFYLGNAFFGLVFYKVIRNTENKQYFIIFFAFIIGASLYHVFLNVNTPPWTLYVSEVLDGIGMSGVTLNSVVYLISISPPRLTSAYVAISSFTITIGSAISSSLMILLYSKNFARMTRNLTTQFPDYADTITAATLNSKVIYTVDMPAEVKSGIINIYVKSIQIPFIYDLVFVSVGLLLIFFLRSKK